MPKVRLTEDFISHHLHCPDGKNHTEFIDAQVPNFFIEVRRASPGQGTFYVRYRDSSNTTRYVKVARTSEAPLSDARAKAKEIIAELRLGKDFRAEAKAKKDMPTLAQFFDQTYYPYVEPRLRSAKRYKQLFDLKLRQPLGSTKLDALTRKSFSQLHTKLLTDGFSEATCDHVLKLGRAMLSLSCRWEMLDRNVLTRAELYNPDNRIDNVPNEAEFERLLEVLKNAENRPVASVMLFAFATAMRCREILRLRWDVIDVERKTLFITAENSKSKRGRTVFLNSDAMDVIQQIGTKDRYEFVFINPRTEKPFTSIWATWRRFRAMAGLPKMRIHDARHARLTALAKAGVAPLTIQALAGHASFATTARYLHLGDDVLRQATDKVTFANVGRTRQEDMKRAVNVTAESIEKEATIPSAQKPALFLVPQADAAPESQATAEMSPPTKAA